MGRGNTYNLITIVFLVLTVLVVLYVIVRLLGPAPESSEEAVILPTQRILPSFTPTNIPPPTLPPTFTYTPTDTGTPTDSPTPTPTITLSPTITDTPGPTLTPSDTPTPAATDTFTPTFTPTGPTDTFTPTVSPFLFDLRDGQVILTKNSYNSAGCAWEAVAGQVYDQNGVEKTTASGLQVHVFSNNFDRRQQVGSNTIYGMSGWEVPVDNKINNLTYFVQLETSVGTVVSDRIQVTFPSNCDQNVALVRFIQTR
jgi:hypothetical protein